MLPRSIQSAILFCVATIVATLLPTHHAVAEDKLTMKTYTYKKVGDLEIKADVYRTGDETIRPVVVWIHGGALINGHRAGVSERVKNWAIDSGYAFVSIDYRLAPETQLPEIIQDVEDAFTWLRKEGPALLKIDPERIVVTGGSAGGYLTLVTGYRVNPRPNALVAFWGYGDLVGDWYSQPSPHPRHHTTKLSREEAFKQVSGPPVSDSRERVGNGGAFYQHCRQHGIWPESVSGWNPHTEPQRFYPFMPLKNVTADYPPTLLIHGTADTDVPFEQSVLMADEFKKHAAPHQLIAVPEAEHGLAGGDAALIESAYAKAFAFLTQQLEK
ncbi:MAG: alpha/beta hydrolase [Planctomycetota bacterium]|nr:alpha/beta hydrolase [Planctomycetota bacterium]